MYNYDKIMNELQKVAQIQEQAKIQKQIERTRETAKKDELNSVFNKYADPWLWHQLTTECTKSFDEFIDHVKFIEAEQFKGQFFREDLYKEIYQKRDFHINEIYQFKEMIMKSPTLALANDNWNKLQNKDQEYKYEFAKNTGEFKKLYSDKISKLKSGIIEQSIQLSLQQQHENDLKQLEDMRAIISQKDQAINSLQQQHESASRHIEDMRIITNQAIDGLTQSNQEKESLRQVAMECIGITEHFKAKVDSAKTKLDNFIDSHPTVEDIHLLTEIKEILGDSGPQIDIM